MSNYYVSSVAWTAITQWAALTSYSLGQYVRQLAAPTVGNERVFKCTTAGVSGASEPAWTLTNNGTTTDGTAHWTQIGGQEAEQSAGNWKAALPRVACQNTVFVSNTIADTIYVSSDHDEQWTADPAYNCSPKVISVSRSGVSLPPTSTDLTVGAKIEWTGGAGTLTCGFQSYVYGVTFEVNGTTNSANLQIRNRSGDLVAESCKFNLTGTNTGSRIKLGIAETNGPFRITLINPSFKFGSTSQKVVLTGTDDMFITSASAPIDGAGSMPDRFFDSSAGSANALTISKSDFSSFAGTNLYLNGAVNWNSRGITWIDCKVPSTAFTLPNTQPLAIGDFVRYWNCDDSNTTYRFYEQTRYGILKSVTNGARVGGATLPDLTTALAWYNTPLTATWYTPYVSPPIGIYLNSSGGSKTATLHICATHALTNADTWIELATLDNSGNTIGVKHTTRTADILAAGSGLTTTTEDWTANASARQNSFAYVVGDTYKAASNPTRLFICTTGGTSASSEPAGVASAVDGSSFADGTATFVAARRFKMAVTWTPGRVGMIRGHFVTTGAVSASQQVFIDPMLVIT